MKAIISLENTKVEVDFSKPLDISIPMGTGTDNVSAWYVPPVRIEPVITDQFTGSVKLGGSVNFRNISFNPHGNGTHTECVGHISRENYQINESLRDFMFFAELITVTPEKLENGDELISLESITEKFKGSSAKAIIIRTFPNSEEKLSHQYSNTNPPYVESSVMKYLTELGIEHFLIDLPSVDREMDDGVLAAHHQFWEYPYNTQAQRTITEMVFVPNEIKDGSYLLNLQIVNFVNDASPSKPVLYKIKPSQ